MKSFQVLNAIQALCTMWLPNYHFGIFMLFQGVTYTEHSKLFSSLNLKASKKVVREQVTQILQHNKSDANRSSAR
jgi:hypothetical protein